MILVSPDFLCSLLPLWCQACLWWQVCQVQKSGVHWVAQHVWPKACGHDGIKIHFLLDKSHAKLAVTLPTPSLGLICRGWVYKVILSFSLLVIFVSVYICRIGAGHPDSAAAGHHQPASYHSGLSHSVSSFRVNLLSMPLFVLTIYFNSCWVLASLTQMCQVIKETQQLMIFCVSM